MFHWEGNTAWRHCSGRRIAFLRSQIDIWSDFCLLKYSLQVYSKPLKFYVQEDISLPALKSVLFSLPKDIIGTEPKFRMFPHRIRHLNPKAPKNLFDEVQRVPYSIIRLPLSSPHAWCSKIYSVDQNHGSSADFRLALFLKGRAGMPSSGDEV